ncbi:glycine cleavage system H protein [freshwater metagenome]|uniref:Glycine cleavage system H protein n=1 Tax=freshwater metagenome TaxID=449393 RepID=A0A094SLE7_9ZZZZ
MSNIPADLKYTKEHEWVRDLATAGTVAMGITDFAQGALGDIVYVQLPKVGEVISAGKVCGEVESTKSVSEIFAPVTGKVIAINDALSNSPELINSDPYNAGWLVEIEVTETATDLISAAEYGQITA